MQEYKKYFQPKIAPNYPHFHFGNPFTAPTKLTAIDAKSLMLYVTDLQFDNNPNSILNNKDFFMPYLYIKKNPELYKTNLKKLKELESNKLNKVIAEANNSLNNIVAPDVNQKLIGLDAVIYDLFLISLLHERNFGGGDGGGLLLDFDLRLGSKLGGDSDGFDHFLDKEIDKARGHEK